MINYRRIIKLKTQTNVCKQEHKIVLSTIIYPWYLIHTRHGLSTELSPLRVVLLNLEYLFRNTTRPSPLSCRPRTNFHRHYVTGFLIFISYNYCCVHSELSCTRDNLTHVKQYDFNNSPVCRVPNTCFP